MSDPKLKKAMKEIKNICKKHDIAAQVTLISESHSEYLYHLSPTWSVVSLKSNELRFRSKREDHPSKTIQDRKTESSVHMLCQIRDLSAMSFDSMEKILACLNEHIDIKHEPFKGFEPHEEPEQ